MISFIYIIFTTTGYRYWGIKMSKKRYNLLDFINENIGKYILLGPHIFRVDCIQGVDDYAVSERDRNQKVLSVFFSNLTNLERTPDPMRTAYFLEDILDLVLF